MSPASDAILRNYGPFWWMNKLGEVIDLDQVIEGFLSRTSFYVLLSASCLVKTSTTTHVSCHEPFETIGPNKPFCDFFILGVLLKQRCLPMRALG